MVLVYFSGRDANGYMAVPVILVQLICSCEILNVLTRWDFSLLSQNTSHSPSHLWKPDKLTKCHSLPPPPLGSKVTVIFNIHLGGFLEKTSSQRAKIILQVTHSCLDRKENNFTFEVCLGKRMISALILKNGSVSPTSGILK